MKKLILFLILVASCFWEAYAQCPDIALEETYACKVDIEYDDIETNDKAHDQLLLEDNTRVVTGTTYAGQQMRLFIKELDLTGNTIREAAYPIQGDNVSNVQIILDRQTDEYVLFFDTRINNDRDVYFVRIDRATLSSFVQYYGPIVNDIAGVSFSDEFAVKIVDDFIDRYMLVVNQRTPIERNSYVVMVDKTLGYAYCPSFIEINGSREIISHDIIETGSTINNAGCAYGTSYVLVGSVDNFAFAAGLSCTGGLLPIVNIFDVDGNPNTADPAKRIQYENSIFYIAGETGSSLNPSISGKIWLGEFQFNDQFQTNPNWLKIYENIPDKKESLTDMSIRDERCYLTGQTGVWDQVAPTISDLVNPKAYVLEVDAEGNPLWSKEYYEDQATTSYINDLEFYCGAIYGVGGCWDNVFDFASATYSTANRDWYRNKTTPVGELLGEKCHHDIAFEVIDVQVPIEFAQPQPYGECLEANILQGYAEDLICVADCCEEDGLCPADCDPRDSLNITTGVDPLTGVLTACGVGNIDPFWTLINNPPLPGCTNPLIPATGDAFLVNHNNLAIPNWVNQTGATVIAPYDGGCDLNFGCNNPINSAGQRVPYVFERTFCVCDNDEVAINLTLEGDDRVYLELWNISTNALLDTSPTYIWSGTATVNWNIAHSLPIGTYAIRAYLVNTNSTTLGMSVVGSVTSLTGRPTIINDNICCTNNTVNVRKIIDNDCNGVFSSGDALGTGWTFELYDATGTTLLQTDVTDINGELFFNGVDVGTYQVVEIPQAGFTPFGSGTQTITVSPGSFNVLEFYNCPEPIVNKCDSIQTSFTPVQNPADYCCFDIRIDNLEDQCFTNITFTPLGGVQFSSWNLNDPFNWTFASASSGSIDLVSLGGPFIPSGTYVPLSFCLDNYTTTPQQVLVQWFAADGTVCEEILEFECSGCIEIIQDTLTCDDSGYKYTFDFYNAWDKPVYNIEVQNVTPAGTIYTSNITPIGAPIMPGGTSIGNCIFFGDNVADYGDILCFELRAEDIDDCCYCTLDPICLPVPDCCEECDDIEYDITNISIQEDLCCFDVDFYICEDSLFTCVEAVPLNGVTLDYQAAGTGWYLFNPMPTTAHWKPFPTPPGGTYIPSGWTNNKMRFCLGGYDDPTQFPPEEVVIRWKSDLQTVVCEDTLTFNCMPPPIEHCAEVVNDSIVCNDDGTFTFNYDVKNLSGINASTIRVHQVHTKPAGGIFSPTPPYNVSGTFPPNSETSMPPMNISNAMPGDSVCFVVTLFDNVEPANECCHSDTLCFVLPDCCENINGDFEDFTGTWNGTNAWINGNLTNWFVSHGTPTYYFNPGIGMTDNGMWMWSYSGVGEGVYTNYNFVAGNSYTLTYDLYKFSDSNPTSTFQVALSNTLTPSTGGTAIPPTAGTQSVSNQTWAINGVWETITETFTAGTNYSQAWFYPLLTGAPNPNQAAVVIDNVCIVDNGPVDECCTDYQAFCDRVDTGFDIPFNDPTNCTIGVAPLALNECDQVLWLWGDGTSSTAPWNTGVTHTYSTPGTYTICMLVREVDSNGEVCWEKEFCRTVQVTCSDCCTDYEAFCDRVDAGFNIAFNNPDCTVGVSPLALGECDQVRWIWGDGTVSNGTWNSSVTHTYPASGSYTICMVVTEVDSNGEICWEKEFCRTVQVSCLHWEYCDPVIDLGDIILPSGVIHAQDAVISSSNIEQGTNVSLKAGQSIRLESGFSSKVGAELQIIVEDCESDTPE